MIKSIIFDLDGTLVDTLEDIDSVLNEALTRYSLPQVTIEQTRQYVGNGARKLVELALGKNCVKYFDVVYAYYAKRFSEIGNDKTKLYEGEDETLIYLKNKGIKFSVVTNKPQRAADNVYAKFLSKYGFCKVLGQTEYYDLKPNPASTLAVLDEMKMKKEECLFVGDGETDVLTARNAGIKCVSALWGFRSREQLERVGATCFAKEFKDLVGYIFN